MLDTIANGSFVVAYQDGDERLRIVYVGTVKADARKAIQDVLMKGRAAPLAFKVAGLVKPTAEANLSASLTGIAL